MFTKKRRYSFIYIKRVCKKHNLTIVFESEDSRIAGQRGVEFPNFTVNTIDQTYFFSLSTTHGWTGGKSYNYITAINYKPKLTNIYGKLKTKNSATKR